MRRATLVASILLPACVALAATAGGRDGGFVRDDSVYVTENPDVFEDVPSAAALFAEPLAARNASPPLGLWRPLATLSWRLDRIRAGGVADPRPFRTTNLVLNAAVAALAALLLLALKLPPFVAAAAAALFACHPARSEAVFWISGRAELLMTAWSLAAATATLVAPSRLKGPLAALGALFAFASKEQGIVLAPLLAFAPGLAARERVRVVAWVGAATAAAFVWRGHVLGATGPDAPGMQVLPEATTLFSRVPYGLVFLWRYARLAVLPRPLINEYDDPTSAPPAEVALGAGVLLVLVAALAAARRAPRAAFAAALFGAPLAPVLNVLYRTGESFAERLLSLPLAGVALAAALPAARRPKPGALALFTLALVAAARTAERARDWTSERTLAEAATRDAPDVGGSWHMLATSRLGDAILDVPSREDVATAAAALRRAVALSPRRAPVLVNLARKLIADAAPRPWTAEGRADLELAVALLRDAVAAAPWSRELRGLAGAAAWTLGRRAEGEALLREELALHPGEFWATTELAGRLDAEGRADEARGLRSEALGIAERHAASAPADVEVWRAIAHLRLALGRNAEAEDALAFAVAKARRPEDRARYVAELAELVARLGRRGEAERRLREETAAFEDARARAADPDDARAWSAGLGALARARGDRGAARAFYADARRGAYGREAKRIDAILRALDGS